MKCFAYASTAWPLGATQAEDLLRRAYGQPIVQDVGPHVTLVYGEAPDEADIDDILDAFEGVVAGAPVHVTPAGPGQLGDGDPVDVLFVAHDGLGAMRRDFLAGLACMGVGCRQSFSDYRPHITGPADGAPDEIQIAGYGIRVGDVDAFYSTAEPFNALPESDRTPPQAVREAAQRALDVRAEKPASQRGMTPVGIARARDLANGRPVSERTLRRMVAYFDRHESDKAGQTWSEQGKGWQAWNGWGGDAGRAWARRLVERLDRQALCAFTASCFASPVDIHGGWFRVAGPGPNIDRATGRPRTPLTAADLAEMARVDAELRSLGQHRVSVDYMHLSNPDLMPHVQRTPDNMAPLAYAELEYREDDERGPGLYARFEWNRAGRELVESRTTADGRGHLYPSIEFDPRGVFDKREGGRKIGRLFVRAIALLGDQQQPGADLDAITALAAHTEVNADEVGSTAGEDAGEGSETMSPEVSAALVAALAMIGLADEEVAAIKASADAADSDEAGLAAALKHCKEIGAANAVAAAEPMPEPMSEPEPMMGDKRVEAMQAALESLRADVAAMRGEVKAAEAFAAQAQADALRQRAEAEAERRQIVPAQRALFVQAFVGANAAEPDPAAVEAFSAFGEGAPEPVRTTLDEGGAGVQSEEQRRADDFRSNFYPSKGG